MTIAASVQESVLTDQPKQERRSSPKTTQLLPPRYFARRHAVRVLCVWGLVIATLLATMCGVLVPMLIRGQRIRDNNSRLIAEAQPLSDLRLKTKAMVTKNEQQTKWNSWVESAKPDDSLLQTLAAVARATKPEETGIDIDALEIQLPLEYPEKYKQPPRWAAPHLAITAKVEDGISARSWLESLSASDRITEAGSKLAPGSWTGKTVQVNAKPRATRWVP